MRICQTCEKDLENSAFKRDSRTRDGFSKVCLSCRAARLGLTVREYEYRLLINGNGISHSHTVRDQEMTKRWKSIHPEDVKKHAKQYLLRNPDYWRFRTNKRKAYLSNTTENIFSEKDRRQLLLEFDGCCAYCGVKPDKLEMDHIIPLSRGGQHTKSNIVPACFNCNRSKGARTPEQANMEIKHG